MHDHQVTVTLTFDLPNQTNNLFSPADFPQCTPESISLEGLDEG